MFSSSQLKIQIGLLLTVVFSVGEGHHKGRYLGCYRDSAFDESLLIDATHSFTYELTPQLCVDYCRHRDYEYALLQFGYKCFCSTKRPKFKAMATHQSECHLPCRGHDENSCGGNWRYSVYDIKDIPVNHVAGDYDGCYEGRDGDGVLKHDVTIMYKILTPELCVGYCYRHGFIFAGVQDGMECHCGNGKSGRPISHELCDQDCAGDKRLKCGGSTSMAVYHTKLFLPWSRSLMNR